MRVYEHSIEYGQPVPAGDRYWVRINTPEPRAIGIVAGLLAESSIEFTFDPYPDDEYEITVKPDQRKQLDDIIRSFDTEAFE